MCSMSRSHPQVNFRIPPDLKDSLEKAAEENKRSITAELVARLEESFQGQIDHEQLLTAEQARAAAAAARKNVLAAVRQEVLRQLNQAISYGASSAYVELTEFPILNDVDDAADIVKDAIGDELQAAGYRFKWDGYDCLEIQID